MARINYSGGYHTYSVQQGRMKREDEEGGIRRGRNEEKEKGHRG